MGKTAGIIEQYRRAAPQERRELESLTPLDQGIVFIATEHAVVLDEKIIPAAQLEDWEKDSF